MDLIRPVCSFKHLRQIRYTHKNMITARGCNFINLINIMISGDMQNSCFTQYHYLTGVLNSTFTQVVSIKLIIKQENSFIFLSSWHPNPFPFSSCDRDQGEECLSLCWKYSYVLGQVGHWLGRHLRLLKTFPLNHLGRCTIRPYISNGQNLHILKHILNQLPPYTCLSLLSFLGVWNMNTFTLQKINF